MGKVRGNGGVKKCGGRCGRPYEVSLGRCVGVWGVWRKVRRVVGCVKKCGECVGKCMG